MKQGGSETIYLSVPINQCDMCLGGLDALQINPRTQKRIN